LGRALRRVDRLARSPNVRPSGHRRPLGARAVSPVLGPSVKGEPALARPTRDDSGDPRLIERIAGANPLWRAPRIHGELKMLGSSRQTEASKR
jgi:hypothetical protein